MLTTIMDVMGMKILPESERIFMSPGSFPNHASSHGENCNAPPITNRITPAMISHFPMELPPKDCPAAGLPVFVIPYYSRPIGSQQTH